MQFVVFSLDRDQYALPIRSVREIILWTEPRQVASSDDSVCGVISLRGSIVPVFELARRLGVPAAPAETAKILIIERGGDVAGVVVDEVDDVITLHDDQLDRGGAAIAGDCVDAIVELDGRLVVLLRDDQLVAPQAQQVAASSRTEPVTAGSVAGGGRRAA